MSKNTFSNSIIHVFLNYRDIELTPQQHDILITKVSESMCKVHHQDIGNLALATFQTALFHQLLIPILALDKYFFKQRYRKEISETASDIDSIDDTTEEGVIETEEIVIYHFQNVAEYTTIERDLTNAIKVSKNIIFESINIYKFQFLSLHSLLNLHQNLFCHPSFQHYSYQLLKFHHLSKAISV